MIVIADTGALISLATINKLELLDKLYGDVYIPQAVWNELLWHSDKFGNDNITLYKNRIKEITTLNKFVKLVDLGESEAITLYQELNADFLLIDDKDARLIAENNAVICTGTLAVLIKAKFEGEIDCFRPLFLKLKETNRHFSNSLLNKILIEYGEAEL
jgi:predicted nucleic acid-binding protein